MIGFHGAPWRMRLFLYAYRTWVLHGGDIGRFMVQYGLPVVSAYSAKKIYSNIKNTQMSWFSRKKTISMKYPSKLDFDLNRLKKRVNRVEKGYGKELKTYDQSIASASVTNTGTIACISDMAQGDTSLTREGLVIQPRHLYVKLRWTIDGSGDNTITRLIIFRDREQHGTPPTAAELLESDGPLEFMEHDRRPRFKILRDIVIPLAQNGPQHRYKEIFIKFGKKQTINYIGTTSGDASMGKNNLYIYYVTQETTNGPNMTFRSRLRYCDG